jgi:hypothetical protein
MPQALISGMLEPFRVRETHKWVLAVFFLRIFYPVVNAESRNAVWIFRAGVAEIRTGVSKISTPKAKAAFAAAFTCISLW